MDPSFRRELGDQGRCGLGHGDHAFPAVLAGEQGRQVDSGCRRDLLAGDVRLHRCGAARADVDQQGLVPAGGDEPGDKSMFLTLGIEGAEYCDRGHGEGLRSAYASRGSA